LFNWNEEHQEIQIPDEIADDIDNDWVINYADNVVKINIIPDTFLVENLIRVEALR
jgi:hypothetical protein